MVWLFRPADWKHSAHFGWIDGSYAGGVRSVRNKEWIWFGFETQLGDYGKQVIIIIFFVRFEANSNLNWKYRHVKIFRSSEKQKNLRMNGEKQQESICSQSNTTMTSNYTANTSIPVEKISDKKSHKGLLHKKKHFY